MDIVDYENFYNEGQYCILPGSGTRYCQERYCRSCDIYRQWKDNPAAFKRIPMKQDRVLVVGDGGMAAGMAVSQVLMMAQRGKRKRLAAEVSWEELVKAHPLRTTKNDYDGALRRKCVPVEHLDDAKSIIKHLQLAMSRQFSGRTPVGFAANQFGFGLRVIGFKLDTETTMVMINPEIVKKAPKLAPAMEECMSVSGEYWVRRPKFIKVRGTLPDGSSKTFKLHDITARVVCHEVDHLDGVLISDFKRE